MEAKSRKRKGLKLFTKKVAGGQGKYGRRVCVWLDGSEEGGGQGELLLFQGHWEIHVLIDIVLRTSRRYRAGVLQQARYG
jgi:hypothetical protein